VRATGSEFVLPETNSVVNLAGGMAGMRPARIRMNSINATDELNGQACSCRCQPRLDAPAGRVRTVLCSLSHA
jgi:hypothetical protein